MKRKSPARLKFELRKKLLPEIDRPTLAHEIGEFLETRAGKSARGEVLADIQASYLTQKYSVSDRKTGELRRLIERHPDDVTTFLDGMGFKEAVALVKTHGAPPQPISLKELAQALLKTPGELPPKENTISDNEPPRGKRIHRPRPKTDSERSRRRKEAKERYEERRRRYRRGLLIKQFGTYSFPTLTSDELTGPEGPCLDVLFGGGAVSKAAHAGSLEDLFAIDRHRFPKLPSGRRSGRNVVHNLAAFLKCMLHLLDDRVGKEQWLPKGPQRQLVLTGMIARARRHSSKIGDMLAKRLRPYLS